MKRENFNVTTKKTQYLIRDTNKKMMRRSFTSSLVARNSATTSSKFCVAGSATLFSQACTFFGKGWDNASVDVAYRALLRKPEVNERLTSEVAVTIDGRTIEKLIVAQRKCVAEGTQIRVFLAPHLGDAHRLLKAYSLCAYPILQEDGQQMKVMVDGNEGECFADPDDDYARVVIPCLELTKFLAQELLGLLEWEQSPRGAAALLESLYRGAEIPDHVFQTPAVIERRHEKQ